jgi:putative FmdB family regulatory protein
MPIYDYRCRHCGEVYEVFVQKAESAQTRCPGCGAEDMEKLLSSFSVTSHTPRTGGTTCCGREERCETPPCSSGGSCHRG